MLTIGNLTSYVPPAPLAPTPPDFAFCHHAYGAHLMRSEGMYAGGILPQGETHIHYWVTREEQGGSFQSNTLPFDVSFGNVAVKVEIAGPVDIDKVFLVPNHIRGMAGYLANHCLGAGGVGGFVTASIQGLVDYIGDPGADLDAPVYPDNTAFLTVTMSSLARIHTLPGDHDPYMAQFLQQVATNAMRTRGSPHAGIFAERILRYAVQTQRMSRLGTIAWWEDMPLRGNQTERLRRPSNGPPANGTATQVSTSRRRKRSRRI